MTGPLLFDTDVLIDYLRGQSDAVRLLQAEQSEMRVSAASVAELYVGVRDERERSVLDRLTDVLKVVDVNQAIAQQAGLWRRDFGPSHGTGLMDAVIAACASHSGSRLVTLNDRHFPMLDNVWVPYRKP